MYILVLEVRTVKSGTENGTIVPSLHEVDDDVIDVSHIGHLCPMLHVNTHIALYDICKIQAQPPYLTISI